MSIFIWYIQTIEVQSAHRYSWTSMYYDYYCFVFVVLVIFSSFGFHPFSAFGGSN